MFRTAVKPGDFSESYTINRTQVIYGIAQITEDIFPEYRKKIVREIHTEAQTEKDGTER